MFLKEIENSIEHMAKEQFIMPMEIDMKALLSLIPKMDLEDILVNKEINTSVNLKMMLHMEKECSMKREKDLK